MVHTVYRWKVSMGESFVVLDQTTKVSPLKFAWIRVHDFRVIVCIEMTLLKYLKKHAKSSTSVVLPDENGPLCKDVPSSSIRQANLEVSEIL